MITENMTLKTKQDAVCWAAQYDLPRDQESRLADWIWSNKPDIGCALAEHPISTITEEDFWDITT